jgi:hypothetical protein
MTKKKSRSTAADRQARLRDKTRRNADKKDRGGNSKGVLDLSRVEVDFYKPKKGRNLIDIIPYTIKTKKHPDVAAGDAEIGDPDYVLDIFVHRFAGPAENTFVCPLRTYGKPCPICEEMKALNEGGGDKDEISKLRPTRRVFYNLIDLDDDEEKIKLFEVSHFLFEKELLEAAENEEDELVVFSDLEEGRSVSFRTSEKEFSGNSFFEFKSFQFKERDEPYDDEIQEQAHSLDEMLVVADYDTMRKAFYGLDDDEDEEVEEEKPKRSSKKRKGKAPETEVGDEEDGDDADEEVGEDEDVEEEKPKRTKKAAAKSKGNKCPAGGTFGKDCDEFDECADCELWDECVNKQDELLDEEE